MEKLEKIMGVCSTFASTLNSKGSDFSFIMRLYDEYKNDLISLCNQMQDLRAQMLSKGYNADFSDREAEILYLLVRHFKPKTVVEISPCHGYSTNYILSALSDNKEGFLYSYEIMAEVNGINIKKVITGNLCKKADQSRLEIIVGDARNATIPDADFLFIDSCHEAYFSAWYFNELISRASVVMVHDIISVNGKTICPKAAFLGIREQYYVLESLALNNQKFFAVAEFESQNWPYLIKWIPARYNAVNRSIVFPGHRQVNESLIQHRYQFEIERIRQLIYFGDRITALKWINDVIDDDLPIFIKIQASALLPIMGYRYPIYQRDLKTIGIEPNDMTISRFAALLETYLLMCNFNKITELYNIGRQSELNRSAVNFLSQGYYRMAGKYLNINILYDQIKTKYLSLISNKARK